METRNITIVSTSNQHKYVVSTDATTLAELKAALAAQGVPYDGMTFYEGLSHTELLTDDAVLPHDVPYKGEVTNELVFMLTLPNKKIKSGASSLSDARQALYRAVEEYDLKDKCVATYGRNFTQCKNSELLALVEEASASANEAPCSCCAKVEEALIALIDILEDDDILLSGDAADIRAILESGSEDKGPKSRYSDSDIDAMFDFLG